MPPGSCSPFCNNFLISILEDKVVLQGGGHVRNLTFLTPQVGRIMHFHAIKVDINKV
jgi:hypothetical protein